MSTNYSDIVEKCKGKNYWVEFKRVNTQGELVFLAVAQKGFKYDADGKKKRNKITKSFSFAENTPKKAIVDELIHQSKLLLEQLQGGVNKSNDELTLYDFIPQYLESAKVELCEKNYLNYEKFIKNYIIPALGHHKLKEIEPKHTQAFLNQIINAPKIGKDGKPSTSGETVKSETVKRKFAILQSVLSKAVDQRIIPYNPADARYMSFPKPEPKEINNFFTEDEIRDVLCLIRKDNNLQFKTAMFLSFYTGLREGELTSLKFSDVNFEEQSLSVLRSIESTGNVKSTKGNRSRKIPLTHECIRLLKELQQKHIDDKNRLGDNWEGDDWIFTQTNGKKMDLTTPYKQFTKFQAKHNIPHHKLHLLRHAFATIMAQRQGVSVKTIQELLGHSSIQTTSIYLHSNYKEMQKAINALEEELIIATTA